MCCTYLRPAAVMFSAGWNRRTCTLHSASVSKRQPHRGATLARCFVDIETEDIKGISQWLSSTRLQKDTFGYSLQKWRGGCVGMLCWYLWLFLAEMAGRLCWHAVLTPKTFEMCVNAHAHACVHECACVSVFVCVCALSVISVTGLIANQFFMS